MQQIVDLQNDAEFQSLDVALLSLAFDTPAELAAGAEEYGISRVPLLADADHSVAEAYGVLEWAVSTGEPGHTFVLVDAEGHAVWIQDFGAAENGGRMYVPPEEITVAVRTALSP